MNPSAPDPTSEHRRDRSTSFGAVADLYDDIRPTYPLAALDWALQPLGRGRWRIADIGAGTGIMSRLLVTAGHDVVAVEPDPQMRRRLQEASSGVTALAGSAESVPLPDGGVDAAVAAQAYHWFDPEPTHAELARVIRPGGVFAAVWNDRDESVDWVAAYSRIVDADRGTDGSGPGSGRPPTISFGDGFEPTDTAVFRHSVRLPIDALVPLMVSRSYFLTATPDRQAELEAEVRHLGRTHPQLAGETAVDLPYTTTVYRSRRS